MRVQFTITFKQGTRTIAKVDGREGGVDAADLTLGDVAENVLKTEQFLERLTGHRVHIDMDTTAGK